MASNITNSATFSTTNMKPAAGEQADALWAQNISDNTGYLYFETRRGPEFSLHVAPPNANTFNFQGTKRFLKRAGQTRFIGSMVFSGTSAGAGLQGFGTLYLNGASVLTTTFTIPSGARQYVRTGVNIDASGLTDGSMYDVSFSCSAPGASGGGPAWDLEIETWAAA